MTHVIRVLSRVFLAALFAVCVYRAITQSITHDEALTWELYLAGPASAIFHHFDANHHFLNTLLMRVSAALFGTSEFTLRLPALAGAALYFCAADRLAGFFSNAWAYLMSVALMTLNPFILDFMAAARGYGLALALFMWALIWIAEQQPRRAMFAGAALALSVTANLVFLPPAAALAAAGLYVFRKPAAEPSKKRRASEPRKMAPWMLFAAPAAAIAVLYFLLAPLENASMEHFYVGAGSISESLRSMAKVSFQHSGPFKDAPWNSKWTDAVAFGIAPLIVAAGLLAGYRRRDVFMLLVSASVAMSSIILAASHFALDRPYPSDRTGIYFLPLIAVLLAALADREKPASIPAFAIGLIVAAQFATEFNTRKFLLWEYDADSRALAQAVAAHRDPKAPIVHAGASWIVSKSLFFYASKYGWQWLEITTRPIPGLDIYALPAEDRGKVSELRLHEVFVGPLSQSVVAVPNK